MSRVEDLKQEIVSDKNLCDMWRLGHISSGKLLDLLEGESGE